MRQPLTLLSPARPSDAPRTAAAAHAPAAALPALEAIRIRVPARPAPPPLERLAPLAELGRLAERAIELERLAHAQLTAASRRETAARVVASRLRARHEAARAFARSIGELLALEPAATEREPDASSATATTDPPSSPRAPAPEPARTDDHPSDRAPAREPERGEVRP